MGAAGGEGCAPAYRRRLEETWRCQGLVFYGSAIGDMRAMAMALAATPAFGKAMAALNSKRSSLNGTPIRTAMNFETVTGTDTASQQTAQNDNSPQPTSVTGAVMGGLMNRMKQRREQQKAASGESPNRSTLFESTTEVLRASSTAAAADVAIPANFKQR